MASPRCDFLLLSWLILTTAMDVSPPPLPHPRDLPTICLLLYPPPPSTPTSPLPFPHFSPSANESTKSDTSLPMHCTERLMWPDCRAGLRIKRPFPKPIPTRRPLCTINDAAESAGADGLPGRGREIPNGLERPLRREWAGRSEPNDFGTTEHAQDKWNRRQRDVD